ncbi:hypothetical protein DPMN_091892 [Dreissena polymorpha]|uniref:Uncharacterized protein n=1 Tax=Dreissena polymorpha TaxID=45954 RepID=A0A9D4L1C0_DREPO|nr:hypothetical protein DPMN_091892 [Dreissena polymorpha]
MAECRTALFPAFKHGCGALQGIVTSGTSILDEPFFNENENQIVYQGLIQLYTKSILMDKIKEFNKKPVLLIPVKIFSLKKQNISFPALIAVDKEQQDKIKH